MRKAMARTLIELASKNKDLYVITADVGFKVFKEFREKFPSQFINVGIAEANMIGMAAGLSLCNKDVYVYSVATFATMRCFEQIRIDICYQNLPVKIIGGGAGLVYGTAGATHQAIEDISLMNSLPNMTVIAPGDPVEVEHTIKESVNLKGPCYIRLAKNHEKIVHESNVNFKVGKAIEVYKGKTIVIATTGNMLNTAIDVRNILLEQNIKCGVVSFHTIKPIDSDFLKKLSEDYETIITIEEHILKCGLGSVIANEIIDNNLSITLKKFGILDEYSPFSGEQNYLREYYGLLPNQIANYIKARY